MKLEALEETKAETTRLTFPAIAAFAALFAYAAALTMPQTSVNEMRDAFHVSNSTLGGIAPALMVGFLIAAVGGGKLSDRLGKLPLVLLGCALMAAGMLVFARTRTFGVLRVGAFLAGLGGGLAEVTGTALISDLYHGSIRTMMMNWAQVAFSAGAVAQPLMFAGLLSAGKSWRAGYLAAAIVSVLCGLVALRATVKNGVKVEPPHELSASWRRIIRNRLVLQLSISLTLYVGGEIGLASWIAAYLEKDLGSPGPLAAASVAVFWVGIGVGRMVGAGLTKHLRDHTLVCWAFGLGAACQAILLLMHAPAIALAMTFCAGFCLGPTWPTIISLAGGAFPRNSGAVIGIVAAFGCAGAAIVPKLVGWASDSVGLRSALWICVGCLLMGLGMMAWTSTGNTKAKRFVGIVFVSVICGAVAIAAAAALTLVLSVAVCLGCHPEAARNAEWAASLVGVAVGGALARRRGVAASLGTGIVVGLVWALTWLYLVGRFDTSLWLSEALPTISGHHVLGWLAAPAFAVAGGALAARCKKRLWSGIILCLAAMVVLLVTAINTVWLVDAPGKHQLAKGATVMVYAPDHEGTVARLFTFDLKANPRLRLGLYDCDSDDSHPFDDINTSYFGTPALSVFDRRGPDALCVVNAGFFTWTKRGRIGSHVAPVVQNGRARYNVLDKPEVWTFGWRNGKRSAGFDLIRQAPFERLSEFDTAIVHVRSLVVDGKALKLGPGAGVTGLKCSRSSVAWSENSSKLYLLVALDPDGEFASIRKWKRGGGQVGGWDLPRVQQFWMKMGARQAIALDGGDSTQVVYRQRRRITSDSSGRMALTLGYLKERPVRIWIPILPARYSDAGVMNYLYVERASGR